MNYKKITALFIAFTAALSLYSCGENQTSSDTVSEPEVTLSLVTELPADPETFVTDSSDSADAKPAGDEAVFSEISRNFVFSGGSGEWSTTVKIEDDGSFEGIYQDKGYETDENGFAVPVIDYCGFRGKFGKVKKIDDLSYSITLKELNTTDELTPSGDYIMKYTDQPYGFEDCFYYTIYKKGYSMEAMPAECQRWLMLSNKWSMVPDTLPFDVLFNTSSEYPFCGTDIAEVPGTAEEPEAAVSDDPMTVLSGPYLFETGINDWSTTLNLGADGSFTGEYHDTDYDEDEEGNQIVSTEYCSFSGKFGEPVKKDELTYTVKIEELTLLDSIPEDEENEYGYFLSEYAFGLVDSAEYTVYLEGTKTSDLPEGCIERISMPNGWDEESIPETISFTVMYNEEYDSTFAFIKS